MNRELDIRKPPVMFHSIDSFWDCDEFGNRKGPVWANGHFFNIGVKSFYSIKLAILV
jgi:hypothetical protein